MTAPDPGAAATAIRRRAPFGALTEALSAIGTIWILALMLLICADVVGRAALDRPIAGVPEMVQFSIVGIVFLQLAQTLRTGGLTRSEVLLGVLMSRRPRVGHLLEALFALTGLTLFVAMRHFAKGATMMIEDYAHGTMRKGLIIFVLSLSYAVTATGLFAHARIAF